MEFSSTDGQVFAYASTVSEWNTAMMSTAAYVSTAMPYQNWAAQQNRWAGECGYCGNRSAERDRRGNCIACGAPR